jgi:hypothetical protein
MPYTSPLTYSHLVNQRHKLNTNAAIWMDELMFNHLLCTEAFYYGVAKFIYVIREPFPTINGIVSHHKYSPEAAVRYYCYRLRRLCEMAKRTPGAVLLTWDDLLTGRLDGEVEDYLNLKTPIQKLPEWYNSYRQEFPDVVPTDLREWAEDSYERHLFFLKNQDLRYWK